MEIATGEVDLEGQFDAPGASLATSETPKVDAGSNRLLGFSLFTTSTNGTQSSSSSTEVKYAVDAAGNMTSDGLRKFVYDSSNRLSKVEAVNGGDAMAYEYLHNALGQRVFKSDALVKSTTDDGKFATGFIGWLKSNFGWLYAPGQTGRARTGLGFVYDEAGNMLAAYGNGSNFAAQQQMEVIWLPLEDGSWIPVGLFKGGQLHAIHADHLGTPRLITNSVKTPVWQWPYSAFGNNKPSGPLQSVTLTTAIATTTQLKVAAPAVDFDLRFPGQYWDRESYLAYNWWRYYQAPHGRYSQFDLIRLRGGWNGFGYVGANPLTYTDLQGLQAGTQTGSPASSTASTQNACVANSPTDECSYYAKRCAESGGKDIYYCKLAPSVCRSTPESNWTSCVRACLQRADNNVCYTPDGKIDPSCDRCAHRLLGIVCYELSKAEVLGKGNTMSSNARLTGQDWFWIVFTAVIGSVATFGGFILFLPAYFVALLIGYLAVRRYQQFFDRKRRTMLVLKTLAVVIPVFAVLCLAEIGLMPSMF